MRTLAFLLVAGLAVTFLTGCVVPANHSVAACLFSEVQGPVAVGDTDAGCGKVGKATATGIICFSTGDASIKAAMDAEGITKIHHVDEHVFSVLGLYAKYTTVVYGE